MVGLVALLIWLLYRRLRPYIQALRQVLQAFTGKIDPTSQSASGLRYDAQALRAG
jgi:hypothetical protein